MAGCYHCELDILAQILSHPCKKYIKTAENRISQTVPAPTHPVQLRSSLSEVDKQREWPPAIQPSWIILSIMPTEFCGFPCISTLCEFSLGPNRSSRPKPRTGEWAPGKRTSSEPAEPGARHKTQCDRVADYAAFLQIDTERSHADLTAVHATSPTTVT